MLDRLHQAMILFAASRGEALRRFLVEEGVGRDTRFGGWRRPCRPCTRPAPRRNAGWTACWAARRDSASDSYGGGRDETGIVGGEGGRAMQETGEELVRRLQ